MSFPFYGAIPLLFHSNIQSWQMHSLPTLDPYVFLVFFGMKIGGCVAKKTHLKSLSLISGSKDHFHMRERERQYCSSSFAVTQFYLVVNFSITVYYTCFYARSSFYLLTKDVRTSNF